MRSTLPGAADSAAEPTKLRGGVRCVMAFTVVTRMRGRSAAPRVSASRASVVMRCAESAEVGETRS